MDVEPYDVIARGCVLAVVIARDAQALAARLSDSSLRPSPSNCELITTVLLNALPGGHYGSQQA